MICIIAYLTVMCPILHTHTHIHPLNSYSAIGLLRSTNYSVEVATITDVPGELRAPSTIYVVTLPNPPGLQLHY